MSRARRCRTCWELGHTSRSCVRGAPPLPLIPTVAPWHLPRALEEEYRRNGFDPDVAAAFSPCGPGKTPARLRARTDENDEPRRGPSPWRRFVCTRCQVVNCKGACAALPRALPHAVPEPGATLPP